MPEESKSLDELIARREDLIRLQEAIQKRLANATEEEQREIEAVSKRAIKPECSFDRKHRKLLYTMALYPEGATTLFNLTYGYGSAGSNNGQVNSITDSLDNGRSASYTYDALHRLSTAVTTGSTAYPQWGLQWTYDRYGNRTAQSISAGCVAPICPTNSVSTDGNNHISGSPYAYDANGNMTNDGQNTLVYDGENHATSSNGSLGSGMYSYDGNGLRVQKVSGGTTNVYIFSRGKVIAEYQNGSPTKEYVYSGGTLLATIAGTTTTYHHPDHLSVRVTTDSSGNEIGEQGHFPFGEQWYSLNTTTKWQFTSYERDTESGNDYAKARYDVNRLGRFSAPDALPGSGADPQSLNRYDYAANDPTDVVDPDGTCPSSGPLIVGGKVICTSARGKDRGNLIGGIVWIDLGPALGGFIGDGWEVEVGLILGSQFFPIYGPSGSDPSGIALAKKTLLELSKTDLKLKDKCCKP